MKAVAGELPAPIEIAAWSFETKWDGMRIIACANGRDLRLWSGNRIDVTHRFPELEHAGGALGGRAIVLDGEVVALDEGGKPSFAALQPRMHLARAADARRRAVQIPVTYLVFDVMHFDGHDLAPLPLEQRLAVLDDLFEDGPAWRQVDRHDDGNALFAAVATAGLEGIMAKRRDAPYVPGRRSPSWRKVKARRRAEFVVGGWLPGAGSRDGRLGSVLVGYYDGAGTLRFAGRVGSGFNEESLDSMGALLRPLARDADPFTPALTRAEAPGARFVDPAVVVEVAFGEWTPDGRLRHPSYLGRRFDKDPREVTRE
jgi:bifunctional non-homologous end joining protein LigD